MCWRWLEVLCLPGGLWVGDRAPIFSKIVVLANGCSSTSSLIAALLSCSLNLASFFLASSLFMVSPPAVLTVRALCLTALEGLCPTSQWNWLCFSGVSCSNWLCFSGLPLSSSFFFLNPGLPRCFSGEQEDFSSMRLSALVMLQWTILSFSGRSFHMNSPQWMGWFRSLFYCCLFCSNERHGVGNIKGSLQV